MDDQEIHSRFDQFAGEQEDYERLFRDRPLLAHYTSIETLEKIMRTNEVWFSNPLFMNDLQEMRFGVNEGLRLFETAEAVDRAAGSNERAHALRHYFRHFFSEFDTKHALDVYVFCLTEHEPAKADGLLSMWRGYGGQGNGAALVFKTDWMVRNPSAPLIIAKVRYGSSEERSAYLQRKLDNWCATLAETDISTEKLYIPAFQFWHFVKVYALSAKHHGFEEEREWRIVYLPDRDPDKRLNAKFGYVVGRQGVEPKLRFQLEPAATAEAATWTFASILDRIILGPSVSTPLAVQSIKRMLESMGKAEFCEKVTPSTIPLRPS